MSWIWVLIPLGAIFAGAFREWLNFKTDQLKSTEHISGEVEDLSAKLIEMGDERNRLTERIQNLEAIVTSQMYDTVVQPGKISLEDEELPDEEQIKKIARRLKN